MSNLELLPKYTYSDYCQWEGDWELIEGIAVSMAPAPMKIHQKIAREMVLALSNALDDEVCPECEILYETDWKISENTTLRPDVVLVCDDESEKYISKAPKIVAEILSPSTAQKDETVKFNIYEDEKVEYYILVYPDDLKAKVYQLKGDKYSKVGDYSNQKLSFESSECSLEIDFKEIFKRFK